MLSLHTWDVRGVRATASALPPWRSSIQWAGQEKPPLQGQGQGLRVLLGSWGCTGTKGPGGTGPTLGATVQV